MQQDARGGHASCRVGGERCNSLIAPQLVSFVPCSVEADVYHSPRRWLERRMRVEVLERGVAHHLSTNSLEVGTARWDNSARAST